MWQIYQNLSTKKSWSLAAFRKSTNIQSSRSHPNPIFMVLVRPYTMIQQQPYILHPFVWINPIQLQPITYTVLNYNYKDTHHKTQVQHTQKHDSNS